MLSCEDGRRSVITTCRHDETYNMTAVSGVVSERSLAGDIQRIF